MLIGDECFDTVANFAINYPILVYYLIEKSRVGTPLYSITTFLLKL